MLFIENKPSHGGLLGLALRSVRVVDEKTTKICMMIVHTKPAGA